MLLRINDEQKQKSITKSLSMPYGILRKSARIFPHQNTARVLPCVSSRGSFTVEAAFVLPLFLFGIALIMGLFFLIQVQIQVNSGLQYAGRMMAVSCQEAEGGTAEKLVSTAEGQVLFRTYLSKHGIQKNAVWGGMAGIIITDLDSDEDYVVLKASYSVKPPISFAGYNHFSVTQCVRCKKWNGASDEEDSDEEEGYVYITPNGTAYHKSTSCRYLDLSIRTVSVSSLSTLRNKSGGIYYPCHCYVKGAATAYITDYGTKYHSDLSCSGLKRTVTRVPISQVGGRHPCSKCYGK